MQAFEPGSGETQVDGQAIGLHLEDGLTHFLGPEDPGLWLSFVITCSDLWWESFHCPIEKSLQSGD